MVERFKGRVSEGMQVKTADGEKLGKVVACQPNGFVVEKGFLFPKDLTVPYDRISGVANGEIVLTMARADLGEQGGVRAAAAAGATRAGASGLVDEMKGAGRSLKEAVTGTAGEARATLEGKEGAWTGGLDQFGKAGEITVPLVEEEIIATKHVEKVGEVHIRKEIVAEGRQITVPVTREVLRVERVSVSHEVAEGGKLFEKESYDIPIREEHVTVEKHPVVREEVRIGKEVQQGEEIANATLRRERAEIETLGAVRRAAGTTPSAESALMSARTPGTGGSAR
jgi:uncharacterized protein (TIGR02271 family)